MALRIEGFLSSLRGRDLTPEEKDEQIIAEIKGYSATEIDEALTRTWELRDEIPEDDPMRVDAHAARQKLFAAAQRISALRKDLENAPWGEEYIEDSWAGAQFEMPPFGEE